MRRVSPLERIRLFGRAGLDVVAALGRSTLFLGHALLGRRTPGTGLHLLVKQLYSVGVLSLAIIVVSGLFIGMVLALQGYNILISYGSEQAVGQMVALTLLRELGPVVTGLLFAGRAGSALTAEIGNMKATEQLSSLEMIGVDPLKYIVAPRLWAGFISMPLLARDLQRGRHLGWGDGRGRLAGRIRGVVLGEHAEQRAVHRGCAQRRDQSIVFAFVVTWIAVYQGYDCEPTSEGISRATTRTVVYASWRCWGSTSF